MFRELMNEGQLLVEELKSRCQMFLFFKAVLFVWFEVISATTCISEHASQGLAWPFVRF